MRWWWHRDWFQHDERWAYCCCCTRIKKKNKTHTREMLGLKWHCDCKSSITCTLAFCVQRIPRHIISQCCSSKWYDIIIIINNMHTVIQKHVQNIVSCTARLQHCHAMWDFIYALIMTLCYLNFQFGWRAVGTAISQRGVVYAASWHIQNAILHCLCCVHIVVI